MSWITGTASEYPALQRDTEPLERSFAAGQAWREWWIAPLRVLPRRFGLFDVWLRILPPGVVAWFSASSEEVLS